MLRHDLTSLRLFVAVCETRSLTRAAERLHIALSAASRRLHQIEEEVGMALVKRLPHGLEPTMAGQTTLRYAQTVLRLADELVVTIDDHRAGVSGSLRVFASSSVLVACLAGDLATFARSHPRIRIDLEERPTAEIIQAVQRRVADIGVIVRGAPIGNLISWSYAKDRLAVVVHQDHRLAERSSVKLAELLEEDFVGLDSGSAVYRLVDEQVRALGRVIKLRVQVRSFEVMCQMAAHRLGIGILPEAALRPLAAALGIRLITLDEPWALRDLDLVVARDGEPNPASVLLLDTLRGPRIAVK
ncbi:MAG: LysR family transcriptional regulator [Bosea sp. (in: a-proteobacteria)]